MTNNQNPKKKQSHVGLIIITIFIIIVFATLPFHYILFDSKAYDDLSGTTYNAGKILRIYPKTNLTFSNSFVFQVDIEMLIERHNESSGVEQQAINTEPLYRLLKEKGIINEENTLSSDEESVQTNNYASNSEEFDETVSDKVLEVTAKLLYADFEENEVSANAKYKNQILKVTGSVSSITSSEQNGIEISLIGKIYYGANYCVYCSFFDNYIDEVSQIKKGQIITIQGTCIDKDAFGPILKNCSIIYE